MERHIRDFLMRTKRDLHRGGKSDVERMAPKLVGVSTKFRPKKIMTMLGADKKDVLLAHKITEKFSSDKLLSMSAAIAVVATARSNKTSVKAELKNLSQNVKNELKWRKNTEIAISMAIVLMLWGLMLKGALSFLAVAALIIFVWSMRTVPPQGTEAESEPATAAKKPKPSTPSAPAGDMGII